MRQFIIKILLLMGVVVLCDHVASALLKEGLRRYNHLNRDAELLFLGHSHTENGIDERTIESGLGVKVSKYFIPGANSVERLVMFQNYLREQPHRPRVLVYDVDSKTFEKAKLSDNFYVQFFPYMDLPAVAHYIKRNGSSWDEFICRKYLRLMRYNDPFLLRCAAKGYLDPHVDVSHDEVDVAALLKKLRASPGREYRIDGEAKKAFEDTIALARKNGITVVLLFIPTVDIYNEYFSVAVRNNIDKFKQYARENGNVIFLDYNSTYEHCRRMFHDAAHMNRYGQQVVSRNLVSDLKRLRLF